MADNIIHIGSLRFRVRGEGELDLKLLALSEDPDTENPTEQNLKSIAMQTATSRLPTVLSNFIQQYVQLEFSVDAIDEVFIINKIVFYVKPMYTSFPG